MERSLLAAALLLAASAPSALAQAPSPAAARPVLLRLKFTPGEALYYVGTDDSREARTRTLTKTLVRETVKAIRASDGAATVEISADTTSMTVSGKTAPTMPALPRELAVLGTMVILPDGRVLSFTPIAGLRGMLSMPGADLSHTDFLDAMTYFPDTPVKVGDTWERRVPSATRAVQPLVRFTLSGLDTAGGTTVALIDFTVSGAAPAGAGVKQTFSEKGRLRFDVGSGAVVSQSRGSDFTITATTPCGSRPYSERMTGKQTLTGVSAPRLKTRTKKEGGDESPPSSFVSRRRPVSARPLRVWSAAAGLARARRAPAG